MATPHRLLLLVFGVLASSACDAPPDPPAAAETPTPAVREGMPAVGPADRDQLVGEVRELTPAGHYTYLRVGEADTPGDWAVVMGPVDVPVGGAIELRVQGSVDDFHSRQLDRDFDRLFFASVATRETTT